MGVQDGQAVNAAVTNPAFINKNVDDTTPSKLGLADPDTVSGTAITNTQRELNAIDSFTGNPANSAKTSLPSWTHNQVGSSSDNLKQRADDLTALFDGLTGHTHDGTNGNGPALVSGVHVIGYPSITGDVTISPGINTTMSQAGSTITINAIAASGTGAEPGYFGAWPFVVGSAAQFAAGAATHTSIASAISVATTGDSIKILKNTFNESITINKELYIVGSGHSSVINGTITFDTGSSWSTLESIKTTDSITLNAAVSGCFVRGVWLSSGKTFIDNGNGNLLEGIQE